VRGSLLLFSLIVTVNAWAGTAKSQARIGELLIAADNIEETKEIEHRPPSRAGYHFVRVTGIVTNVGKHALCAHVSAVLETTFNLQSYASVFLDGRYTSRVNQMLPGEQAHVDFRFDVKDGVQPLTLVVKQGKRQGCSTKEPLPVYNPEGRFPVTSIARAKQEMSP
jgi:hypothetical protein